MQSLAHIDTLLKVGLTQKYNSEFHLPVLSNPNSNFEILTEENPAFAAVNKAIPVAYPVKYYRKGNAEYIFK
jgi:hypothetical protein